MSALIFHFKDFQGRQAKPNGCRLSYHASVGSSSGNYSCGHATKISCSECKYGNGRKDPEAKCNRDK